MKNRRAGVNLLGTLLLLVTVAIVVFAVLYLSGRTPGLRRDAGWKRYEYGAGDDFNPWKRVEQERLIYEAFDSLAVRNISGRIEVTGWDKEYALVSYTKRGPFAQELEVITEIDDMTLSVRPAYRNRMRTPFTSVTFDIFVPRRIGSIEAESTSGSIGLFTLGNSVDQELKTVSGRIQTDGARNLSAVSTSGSIKFRFSGSTLSVRSVSGSVHGDIVDFAPGGTGELSTVSGAVRLKAYKGLDARVGLISKSGAVSCGFPLQKKQGKNHELSGSIGSGLSSLTVRSTSGSIRLDGL